MMTNGFGVAKWALARFLRGMKNLTTTHCAHMLDDMSGFLAAHGLSVEVSYGRTGYTVVMRGDKPYIGHGADLALAWADAYDAWRFEQKES